MVLQELQPKTEDGSCIEVTAANSLFLNSFERWVAASVTCSQKGDSIEERASSIRKSYEMAIKANIEYHTEMSRLNGDRDWRWRRHTGRSFPTSRCIASIVHPRP